MWSSRDIILQDWLCNGGMLTRCVTRRVHGRSKWTTATPILIFSRRKQSRARDLSCCCQLPPSRASSSCCCGWSTHHTNLPISSQPACSSFPTTLLSPTIASLSRYRTSQDAWYFKRVDVISTFSVNNGTTTSGVYAAATTSDALGTNTPVSISEWVMQLRILLTLTSRFGWFVGHLTLLFCSLRYSLSYITFNYYSRWARVSYRTAFVAAAATYGIVVYKAYRARSRSGSRQQPGALALLGDENVQYLCKS